MTDHWLSKKPRALFSEIPNACGRNRIFDDPLQHRDVKSDNDQMDRLVALAKGKAWSGTPGGERGGFLLWRVPAVYRPPAVNEPDHGI